VLHIFISASLPRIPLNPLSTVLAFPEYPIVGITQYVTFSVWLLSLGSLLSFKHGFPSLLAPNAYPSS
jgi:hypothetical protein